MKNIELSSQEKIERYMSYLNIVVDQFRTAMIAGDTKSVLSSLDDIESYSGQLQDAAMYLTLEVTELSMLEDIESYNGQTL